MSEKQSIKDTLDVIRKALEDDDSTNIDKNILILDQLVNDDGTIKILNDEKLTKKETLNILDQKLNEDFEKYLPNWLEKNMPKYFEKYLKDKKI